MCIWRWLSPSSEYLRASLTASSLIKYRERPCWQCSCNFLTQTTFLQLRCECFQSWELNFTKRLRRQLPTISILCSANLTMFFWKTSEMHWLCGQRFTSKSLCLFLTAKERATNTSFKLLLTTPQSLWQCNYLRNQLGNSTMVSDVFTPARLAMGVCHLLPQLADLRPGASLTCVWAKSACRRGFFSRSMTTKMSPTFKHA